MRFLLLNQFYPPDSAPTGQYLHDLGKVLVERGHQVRVLCSRRSYNGEDAFPARETRDGVEIIRLAATGFGRRGFAGKLADYATFYSSLFAALVSERGKADVILSLTTPPYIGLLGKWAAWRHGCRHAHWIMDLYPDVMFAHGMARKNSLLFRFLQRLTRYQLRGSQFVLALGPMMAAKVDQYWVGEGQVTGGRKQATGDSEISTFHFPLSTFHPHPSIHDSRFTTHDSRFTTLHLPLWSNSALSPWPDHQPNPLRVERGWKESEPVFLYSGNMGLGHRFGEFLEAARQLGASGPRWVFAGGGKRRAEVESFALANPAVRIEFLDYAPHSQLCAHLCAADVHLASLDSAWQGLMVPSKLQGSFAVGRPVLYVGGRNCETAAWIEESGGGWVVPENDLPALLAAIKQACNPSEFRARGLAARRFAENHFCKSSNCAQIAEWMEGAREKQK